MPKRAQGLTAAFCSTVKERGKFSDGEGLMLFVSSGGTKRWTQRLVIRGKRRDLGLGGYPSVSLARARLVAAENRRVAREGGDPLLARDQDMDVPTFNFATEKLLEKKASELSNAKHIAQWGSTLETYAGPKLGSKRVTEITVRDVLEVLEPIWTTKTETASRLRARIENVLSYATAHGWREGPNPATWRGNLDNLLPKPSKVKAVVHQPAIAVSDVPFWFAELRHRTGSSARCLELLALTWVRSGEARGATWSEVSFDSATWRIPAERTKTKQEHIIPLSNAAIELLHGLIRQVDTDHIFPSRTGGQLSDMALSAVMRKMHSYKADDDFSPNISSASEGWIDPQSRRPAVPHGLRSTARDWAGKEGYARELAELALGHSIGNKVEQAYHRDSLVERRRPMMEAWAIYLVSERARKSNRSGLRLA